MKSFKEKTLNILVGLMVGALLFGPAAWALTATSFSAITATARVDYQASGLDVVDATGTNESGDTYAVTGSASTGSGTGGEVSLAAGAGGTTGAGGVLSLDGGTAGTGNSTGGAVEIDGGVGGGTSSGGAVTITGGAADATASIATGSAVSLTGGAGGGTSGAGGTASLVGGAGTAGNSLGGVTSVTGGAGAGTSAGGAVNVTGGAGGATNTTGGAVNIDGGVDGGAGTGGAVTIDGGVGDTAGNVQLVATTGLLQVGAGAQVASIGDIRIFTVTDADVAGAIADGTCAEGAAVTVTGIVAADRILGVTRTSTDLVAEFTLTDPLPGAGTVTWRVCNDSLAGGADDPGAVADLVVVWMTTS